MEKKKHIIIIMAALLLCLFCIAGCQRAEKGEIRYISPTASEQALRLIPIEKSTPTPTGKPTTVKTPVNTQTPAPTVAPSPTPSPTSGIESRIADMTIEEKIGQLVMFGFSGTETVPAEFKSIMRTYIIGNVILYGPNIDKDGTDGGFSQCRKLTDRLRAVNTTGIPLAIAIDVEGGDVIRFRWKKELLSAKALGEKNDVGLAEAQFERIGNGLRSAGIDIDLAPVMDIAQKPSETFLKKRIISSSPKITSEIGAACIRGLHESGCLSLVKHFPGHGATTVDSHKQTPVIRKKIEKLEEYDLIPFAAAIEADADGIMVGHLSYPDIDPDHIASQSSYFITDLLRNQMGFNGFVMSDDFRMDGLREHGPLRKAAVNFILAGGDIILCGPNHEYQKEIMKGLYEAYDKGTLTEERIDESLYRILTAKEKYN